MTSKIRALVIAHDARAPGGVNNFLRIMRREYRPYVTALRFSNGRRNGEVGKWNSLTRLVRDYVRFCALLVQRKFDILHVNPSFDRASMPRELVFVVLARIFQPSIKIIIFYRGWEWSVVEYLRRSKSLRWLFTRINKIADAEIVLSSDFADALVDLGLSRDSIFMGTTMFEASAIRAVPKEVEKDPMKVSFVSRFIAAKRGDLVIRAIAALRHEFPDLKLAMVGDGPVREQLQELAHELAVADRTTFPGYIGGVEKMSILRESSIFAFPTSHPEGMPNAVLEAMASGCVIVTTNVGGIRDVVDDGVNGAIIAEGDVEALVGKIREYLLNEDLRVRSSSANEAKAWATWEATIVSENIARLYYHVSKRDCPDGLSQRHIASA